MNKEEINKWFQDLKESGQIESIIVNGKEVYNESR